MASLKLAYGAVLGTVQGAATSVSSVFNATNHGISMLESFITKASEEQRKTHIKEAKVFDQELIDAHGRQVTTLKAKAEEFCAQSPAHRKEYDAACADLMAALYPTSTSTTDES